MGGQAPRILSLDDYFMTEVTKTEIDPETNKKMEIKVMFLYTYIFKNYFALYNIYSNIKSYFIL